MIFCGVFDGHGPWGHFVAKEVRESMPIALLCNWEEALVQTSLLHPHLELNSTKTNLHFNLWERSYIEACAVVDPELERHPKIDTFHSGTTALSIVRQVMLYYLYFVSSVSFSVFIFLTCVYLG